MPRGIDEMLADKTAIENRRNALFLPDICGNERMDVPKNIGKYGTELDHIQQTGPPKVMIATNDSIFSHLPKLQILGSEFAVLAVV